MMLMIAEGFMYGCGFWIAKEAVQSVAGVIKARVGWWLAERAVVSYQRHLAKNT